MAVWLWSVVGWLVAEQPAETSTNAQVTAATVTLRVVNSNPCVTL